MNIVRNSLLGVAVAALMVLPATAAHAAENEIDVTPGNLQGWSVDTDTRTDYRFVDTQHSIGAGSVRFGPISGSSASDKFTIRRFEKIPSGDLQSITFDYYIDPSSPSPALESTARRFYLNLYFDSPLNPGVPTFNECRFDYESTAAGAGWHTTTITPDTVAVLVRPQASGLVCPAPNGSSFRQMPSGSQVINYALNGGDTTTSDAGLIGNFDKFVLTTSTRTTTYDFEPGPACSRDGGQTQNGRSGNDNLRGTDGRDRIEGRDGNDNIDGRGGDDCLIGGDGNDRLVGAAGDDEIQGGQGNDMIDGDAGADMVSGGQGNDQIKGGAGDDNVDAAAGNDIVDVKNDGVDTVNCGAGNDIVFADRNDRVSSNCEVQPGR